MISLYRMTLFIRGPKQLSISTIDGAAHASSSARRIPLTPCCSNSICGRLYAFTTTTGTLCNFHGRGIYRNLMMHIVLVCRKMYVNSLQCCEMHCINFMEFHRIHHAITNGSGEGCCIWRVFDDDLSIRIRKKNVAEQMICNEQFPQSAPTRITSICRNKK